MVGVDADTLGERVLLQAQAGEMAVGPQPQAPGGLKQAKLPLVPGEDGPPRELPGRDHLRPGCHLLKLGDVKRGPAGL
jgi:hypothetical protein